MGKSLLTTVHEHILEEMKVNTKTDTTFVLTSIFINIAVLATNTIIASEADDAVGFIIMGLFIALLLVVNLVAEIGLIKGRQTRDKLIRGLIRMYEDNGVDGYYDKSILEAYKARYTMFMVVVLATGVLAVIVPVIVI